MYLNENNFFIHSHPLPPKHYWKMLHGCFFFLRGGGGYLSWGERGESRLRKKLLIFSTTFVHDCMYSAMCMQVDMHALAVLSNAPTHFIQSLLIKIFCMMPSGICLFMESIARFTSIWVSQLNDMVSFLNWQSRFKLQHQRKICFHDFLLCTWR